MKIIGFWLSREFSGGKSRKNFPNRKLVGGDTNCHISRRNYSIFAMEGIINYGWKNPTKSMRLEGT